MIAPKWLSIRTTSKTIKVTCTLAAEPFRDVVVPEQQSSVSIYVEVDSQTVRAMVKAKAIRKVAAAITAGGDPVVILVGKMAGNEITQAGLSAVPRTPAPLKPEPADIAAALKAGTAPAQLAADHGLSLRHVYRLARAAGDEK